MAANLSRLIGCNVYISEGRNVQLIRRLESLCKQRRYVALANTFIDEPYNRTGLTLVATCLNELSATVTAVAHQALSSIDLRSHIADHPRLGVLDHVSLHPLGPEATLQLAAAAARDIGQQLAAPPTVLPVYYYGSAHTAGRELGEIRRRLGYFKTASHSLPTSNSSSSISNSSISSSSSHGDWIGSIDLQQLSGYPPDAGPLSASSAAGVVTIGAVPWVVNYNVPLHTDDMTAARAVAMAVSTRGGGPAGVQAMALRHGPGVIEVATNLTHMDWTTCSASISGSSSSLGSHAQHDTSFSAARTQQDAAVSGSRPRKGAGPEEVQQAVAAAADKHGLLPPGSGYVTNKMPTQLLEFAAERFGKHC